MVGGLRHSKALLSAACALLACLACSADAKKGDDDDGIANYYLSGRVLNGSTLVPISDAEVTLSVGDSTQRTRSSAAGSFSVGPISPESDYRIAAQLAGFDAFAFYGGRWPRLKDEKDRDRALVGDGALYAAGAGTPAFPISASSADGPLPLDASSAEVRFGPVRLGADLVVTWPPPAA